MVEFKQEDVNALVLAALETIRVNKFMPIELFEETIGGLGTTLATLETKPFKAGWVYIITNITAIETGTATPTMRVGYTSGGNFRLLMVRAAVTANESSEWVGEIMLKETDTIRATFATPVNTDTVQLVVNGYKIRR